MDPMPTPSGDETPMSSHSEGECTNCANIAEKAKQNEEISMAFLLALIPVISLTFFGQIGLL